MPLVLVEVGTWGVNDQTQHFKLRDGRKIVTITVYINAESDLVCGIEFIFADLCGSNVRTLPIIGNTKGVPHTYSIPDRGMIKISGSLASYNDSMVLKSLKFEIISGSPAASGTQEPAAYGTHEFPFSLPVYNLSNVSGFSWNHDGNHFNRCGVLISPGC